MARRRRPRPTSRRRLPRRRTGTAQGSAPRPRSRHWWRPRSRSCVAAEPTGNPVATRSRGVPRPRSDGDRPRAIGRQPFDRVRVRVPQAMHSSVTDPTRRWTRREPHVAHRACVFGVLPLPRSWSSRSETGIVGANGSRPQYRSAGFGARYGRRAVSAGVIGAPRDPGVAGSSFITRLRQPRGMTADSRSGSRGARSAAQSSDGTPVPRRGGGR